MFQLGNVRLRPEVEDDRSFLIELYLSTREAEAGFDLMLPYERNRILTQQFDCQWHDYRSKYPQAWFTIITVNETPVGRLYVATMPSEMRLVELSILPAYQSHGIGSQLVKTIQAEAMRLSRPLRLSVVKGSEALHFYEGLGFTVTGSLPFHLTMEWAPGVNPPPERGGS